MIKVLDLFSRIPGSGGENTGRMAGLSKGRGEKR